MRGWAWGVLLAAGAAMPMAATAQAGPPEAGRHGGGERGPGPGGSGSGEHRGPDGGRPGGGPRPASAPQAPAADRFQGQGRGGFQAHGGGRWQAGGGGDPGARVGGDRRFDGPPPGDRGPGGRAPDGRGLGGRSFGGGSGLDGRGQGFDRGPDGRGAFDHAGGWGGRDGQRWDGHGPRTGGQVTGGYGGGYRGGPSIAPGSGGYRPQGWDGRPGGGYGGGYRGGRGGAWTSGWRDDRRYDWRSYRVTNRYVFNLPRYSAPGGWGYGYRRFGVGYTLAAPLFVEDYWIDDPYSYRLPAAYGPYRWVRYYNDALLIDVRNGVVVDAVYGIFW